MTTMRIAVVLAALLPTTVAGNELSVSPTNVRLASPEASQQLLVYANADGRRTDATRLASFESADPGVATVSATGKVSPQGDGSTEITIKHGEQVARVPVEVSGWQQPSPVVFDHQIVPILSKAGCNSGGCHGKAEGQNGFKLSVFGFDPLADYNALTKEGRGRRVSPATPARSLLLTKASGAMPHGGGVKIEPGTLWYRLVRRWIDEGAQFIQAPDATIQSITVEPAETLIAAGQTQQLRVTAIDASGHRRCITAEAEYQTNAEQIAGVDHDGMISVTGVPGEAAILVRYMGHVAVSRVTLPQPSEQFKRPPEHNFIDGLVWDKLARLGIEPSELADDSAFLRRVYLDVIGRLPTPDEVVGFVNDTEDKRSRIIDVLLDRDEYADYQALRWADILRADKNVVKPQGAVAITRWLRRQFQENTPYDEFARAIVTARGNTYAEGPASFYMVHSKPEAMARSLSQLFLGVRIECAQCHHHPFEKWGQSDYFALAGFFSGVSKKAQPAGGGQKIISKGGADLKHPRTGEVVAAAGLGSEPADFESYSDRREALADWMVATDNPFFARTIANRLWAHFMGRGLVEPIDDLRATNPATNEPLLDALAEHLVELDFDLKAFTRTLLNSRVYQLSSVANASNQLDNQNFSHASWKAVPAEVLLDAICDATEVAEEFNGWPAGYRALQVWDNRMPSYFFRIFGKPARVSVCECERGNEPSMAQALHLMNSDESVAKIRHRDGRANRLASSDLSPEQIINELYLATLSRRPTDKEKSLMLGAFADTPDRRIATEDVLWALINTREFVYNH